MHQINLCMQVLFIPRQTICHYQVDCERNQLKFRPGKVSEVFFKRAFAENDKFIFIKMKGLLSK